MVITAKSRIITISALLLIGSILLVVSLLAIGFFDPIAQENPFWQDTLNPMRIPSGKREVRWLREDLSQSSFSVRLTASHGSGESDSAYGLLLGQEESNIAVMISPLGYVSIWRELAATSATTKDFYLPWQTWPHVRTGDTDNEIFVSLNRDTLSVRVNREWLWEVGEIVSVDRIGIMGESYGEEALINFRFAEISATETTK